MMKKIISFLATFAFLYNPTASFGTFDTETDGIRLMWQIEEEILLCFSTMIRDGENYGYSNGLIDYSPGDVFYLNRQHYFPQTIAALDFIVDKIPKNNAPTGQHLFNKAAEAYQLSRLIEYDQNPVIYHNICHGIQVMLISGVLFESVVKADDDAANKYVDEDKDITKALIMFAGLFHDAAHDGKTNSAYQLDNGANQNLHLKIAASATRIALTAGNDSGFEIPYLKIATDIMALYPDNQGDDFTLEKIHKIIAENYYNIIFSKKLEDDALALVKDSILQTNMATPNVFKTAIDTFSVANEGENEKLAKFNEKFADGGMVQFVELVHMADIGMNATSNFNGVTDVVKLVIQEFQAELVYLKARGFTYAVTKDTSAFGAFCKKDFDKIWEEGQKGFNDYVIDPTIKNEAIFTSTTISTYYGKLKPKFDLLEVGGAEYLATKPLVDGMQQFKDTEFEDLQAYTAYFGLKYMAKNLAANTTLFTTDGLFDSTTGDYLFIDEAQYNEVCIDYDRLLRHIRSII